MFKLIKLNENLFYLIGKKISFEGTREKVIKKMLYMGILEDDIYYGLKDLESDKNEYSEYGINGYFIFSGKFAKKAG